MKSYNQQHTPKAPPALTYTDYVASLPRLGTISTQATAELKKQTKKQKQTRVCNIQNLLSVVSQF
jgi:hypothetical protein